MKNGIIKSKFYYAFFSLIFIFYFLSTAINSKEENTKPLYIQKIPEDPATPSDILKKRNVSILFSGDTHFEWAIEEMQEKFSFNYPVDDIKSVFLESDFRILNLETTISTQSTPLNSKSYVFRSDPENASLLNFLDLDVAVLANNHVMDMGSAGLDDTISNLHTLGIPSVGAGNNIQDASSPYYFKLRGITYALLSFSSIGDKQLFSTSKNPGVAPLSSHVYKQISAVKKNADHVIISLHWGMEYSPRPEKAQILIARRMIDSGATAVIGHHPHIPQGVEFYKSGVIAYSLGNFLFGSINHYQTDNFIVKLLFHPEFKTLEGLEIFPVSGNYKKMGHKISFLNSEQSEKFWKRFYTQCYELNNDKPNISIQPDGRGIWLKKNNQ